MFNKVLTYLHFAHPSSKFYRGASIFEPSPSLSGGPRETYRKLMNKDWYRLCRTGRALAWIDGVMDGGSGENEDRELVCATNQNKIDYDRTETSLKCLISETVWYIQWWA